MRLWASGWSPHGVQLAPKYSRRILFLFRAVWSKKLQVQLPFAGPVGHAPPLSCPDNLCLFSFCSQTFGQSPPFAIRNRREKGGTQPITGFSPIGRGNVRLPRPPCRCPLLFLLVLRGIFRLLTFRPCVASIFRPGFAPRPFDYSSIGLMFHFWAKLGLVVLGPALPRGNLGGHLVLWLSPRARPFNRVAAWLD